VTRVPSRVASAQRRAATRLCAQCAEYERDPDKGREMLFDAVRRISADHDERRTRHELLQKAEFHDAEAARLRDLAASRP
jgi:hypothetical protein